MNEQEKNSKSAETWDERYTRGKYSAAEPHRILTALVKELNAGTALDLACGAGRHAVFLAENGFHVTAVDNSAAGIKIAKKRAAESGVEIDFRLADLEAGEFTIEENAFDLICDFYYLQRGLFDAMKKGVKPGGIIAAAIHIYGENESAGRFTLFEGELRMFFDGFEILHYHETPASDTNAGAHHRRTAEIVARK
jgi:tellurite methyltransferase